MFERILLPLDGSERAERILAEADPILRHPGAKITLFRATDVSPEAALDVTATQARRRKQAEFYLGRLERRLQYEGLEVNSRVREGRAADAILGAAAREESTLILMSTHGRTGLPRWVFGSVSEKVLRASTVPVLVFRSFPDGEAPAKAKPLAIKNLLVPVDDSGHSMEAVSPAAQLASLFRARVHVLNVVDHEPSRAPARTHLEQATRRIEEAGLRASALARDGDAANEILEAARTVHADVIGMASHGRSGPGRWVFGSVAEKVLRTATVPLLVVRPARKADSKEREAAEQALNQA